MSVPIFLSNVDFTKKQLLNTKWHVLSADPSGLTGADEGLHWYNSSTHVFKFYDGTTTQTVATAVGVPTSRTLTAGNGLTGGGDLSADRTFDVVAADGTITVAANDIKVAKALDHTYITDFDTQVRTSRLDQMAAPTAAVNVNSQTITNVTDPVNPQDAATKNYADLIQQGIKWKEPVRVVTTAAETYTISAGAVTQIAGTTVDGVALAINDRILVKDAPAATGVGSANSTQPANGIYAVTNNSTNLTVARAADANASSELLGARVEVEEGTNQQKEFQLGTVAPLTLNTTSLNFFERVNASAISAGAGLAKSGNTLSIENSGVLTIAHGGTGAATAGAARTALGVPAKFAADVTGDGTTTSFAVTHNLGTLDITSDVWDVTATSKVYVEEDKTSTNVLTLVFAVAPANLKVYRVVVIG